MNSSLLEQPVWRVIDQTTLGPAFEAKQSFAIDDALCEAIGAGDSPSTARTWVHHNTIVLGIQDTRLPHLEKGLDYLKQQGYHYIVRNSGGLGVVLDEGVLNISLIFPERQGKISIDAGYDAMVAFVKRMLAAYPVTVDTKEITESYCPGRYDLSVSGKKFAGISQRRLRGGVAVQVYLCADGQGARRAKLIKHFYEAGLANEQTKFTYPTIRPDAMASLSEVTSEPLDVSRLMVLFYMTIRELGRVESTQLTLHEVDLFERYYKRMMDRNEKVFGQLT